MQAAASASWIYALLLGVMVVLSFLTLARPNKPTSLMAIGLLVAAGILLSLGGWPGVPVLALGLAALLGSLYTDSLFEQARQT